MAKVDHICKWDIQVYNIVPMPFDSMIGYDTFEFRVRGFCKNCSRTITREELEIRANVGERELVRQASYEKRDD